jgi:hypothetical protein
MAKNWKSNSLPAPDYGYYDWTKEDRDALGWCVQNKILVYAESTPHQGPWKIIIKLDKKINKSPEAYPQDIVLEKIFEFYRYYANKYRPKDEL